MGLIEATRDRAFSHQQIKTWHMEARGYDAHHAAGCEQSAKEWADDVWCLCLGGFYHLAVVRSDPQEVFWEDWPDHPPQLDECPAWLSFHEAVKLAERIDCLLALLERDGLTRQLARDCRDDLDLLGVLADWCQDNGQPQAAAEARHLGRLVSSHRLG